MLHRAHYPSTRHRSVSAGFTLVEIMIVVVIIGLLAAMGIPALGRVRQRTENTTLVNDLRTFSAAFDQYALEFGRWPADGAAGVVPVEMTGRIKAAAWTRGTPGGGHYDWDFGGLGIQAGISLFACNFTDERLALVDAMIDDGNVNTGKFRRLSDGRPSYILLE